MSCGKVSKPMKHVKVFYQVVCLTTFSTALSAADWPQYRGANHDGSSPEKILKAWPKEGPRILWKATLGPSFGSFAVSGGRAVFFIQSQGDGEDREVAVAFDANSGKEIWDLQLGQEDGRA